MSRDLVRQPNPALRHNTGQSSRHRFTPARHGDHRCLEASGRRARRCGVGRHGHCRHRSGLQRHGQHRNPCRCRWCPQAGQPALLRADHVRHRVRVPQFERYRGQRRASYAWVTTIFSSTLGFFAGWSMLISSVVFMVSGTLPAASANLELLAPGFVGNQNAVMIAAAVASPRLVSSSPSGSS
jgi:hypothetical protein